MHCNSSPYSATGVVYVHSLSTDIHLHLACPSYELLLAVGSKASSSDAIGVS